MGKITHASVGAELSQTEWESNAAHLDSEGNTFELSRCATLVVAASDASSKAKAGADYVCDGTADDVEIQAAIDALPAGGGQVVLSDGTFNIATSISSSLDYLKISGQGYSTIWKRTSGYDVTLLNLSGSYQTIEDIYFHGNKDIGDSPTLGNGITITGADFLTLNHLYIGFAPNIGLYSNNLSGKSVFWFTDIIIISSRTHNAYLRWVNGIMAKGVLLSSSGTSSDNLLMQNSTESYWVNCIFDVSQRFGVYLFQSERIMIANSYFGGSVAEGFYQSGDYQSPGSESRGISLIGNLFRGNGSNGTSADVKFDPLTISYENIIMGNQFDFMTDRAPVAIYLKGNVSNSIVQSNVINDGYTTPISLSDYTGTGSIIKDNIGYLSENSGTATVASGGTTVTVTHGLAATPTRVQVTPTLLSNATSFWVTAKGATTFVINVNADPGAGTATFDWHAQYGEG